MCISHLLLVVFLPTLDYLCCYNTFDQECDLFSYCSEARNIQGQCAGRCACLTRGAFCLTEGMEMLLHPVEGRTIVSLHGEQDGIGGRDKFQCYVLLCEGTQVDGAFQSQSSVEVPTTALGT